MTEKTVLVASNVLDVTSQGLVILIFRIVPLQRVKAIFGQKQSISIWEIGIVSVDELTNQTNRYAVLTTILLVYLGRYLRSSPLKVRP